MGDFLKTGNPAKSRALSASGRTDKDDEFLIVDGKIEIRDCLIAVRIDLINIL